MSVVAAERPTMLDQITVKARQKSTDELRKLYREGREFGSWQPGTTPWYDLMDAVTTVLRERICADWLHTHWCFLAEQCSEVDAHLAGHEQAARGVAAAFESRMLFASTSFAALWPDTPVTAVRLRDLCHSEAFRGLIRALVVVVPAETEAGA